MINNITDSEFYCLQIHSHITLIITIILQEKVKYFSKHNIENEILSNPFFLLPILLLIVKPFSTESLINRFSGGRLTIGITFITYQSSRMHSSCKRFKFRISERNLHSCVQSRLFTTVKCRLTFPGETGTIHV